MYIWEKIYTCVNSIRLYSAYIYFRLNEYRFYLLLIILGGPEKGPLVWPLKRPIG